MLDRLQSAIARAQRSASRVGLLFLDLDGFKQINDNLGHAVGDQVLRLAPSGWRSVVRESDSVSRYGGDEFVVLLAEISSAADAAPIARKILDALAAPAGIGPHPISLKASIGIAIYPDDGADAVTLIRHADAAMYRSKRQGAGGFEFYQDDGSTDPATSSPRTPCRWRSGAPTAPSPSTRRGCASCSRPTASSSARARWRRSSRPAPRRRTTGRSTSWRWRRMRCAIRSRRSAWRPRCSPTRGSTPAAKERQLQLVQRQAALIARLVDDLLDGSRVGTGEFRLQRRELQLDANPRRRRRRLPARDRRQAAAAAARRAGEPAIVTATRSA
jgi:diguanylate cyclase (GGDEF)-like protein